MTQPIEFLDLALYAGADQRVNISCYSDTDGSRATAYDLTGKTLKARLRRPDGASTILTATVTSNTGGEGYITMDSGWTMDAGHLLVTILVDDKPFDRIKRATLVELP